MRYIPFCYVVLLCRLANNETYVIIGRNDLSCRELKRTEEKLHNTKVDAIIIYSIARFYRRVFGFVGAQSGLLARSLSCYGFPFRLICIILLPMVRISLSISLNCKTKLAITVAVTQKLRNKDYE